ncbi:MAG TPA: hypothetical protein VGB63_00860 [Pedobacter sp.]|jgi:hypothetical protein
MTESNFQTQTEIPLNDERRTLPAWVLAKKFAALIGILLFMELIYFMLTANSSLEIAVICIIAFSLVINIPTIYHFYKTSE